MTFTTSAFGSTLFSRFFRSFSTSSPFLSLAPESTARNITTMSDGTQKATVAAGCFWGVEHLYRKQFGNGKGLLDAKVGYSGGHTSSPSYRAVCSGTTGRKYLLPLPSCYPGEKNKGGYPCEHVFADTHDLQTPKPSR